MTVHRIYERGSLNIFDSSASAEAEDVQNILCKLWRRSKHKKKINASAS